MRGYKMNIYILDQGLNITNLIDEYMSIIWTTRYYTSGDFELCVKPTPKILNGLQTNFYLVRDKDINSDSGQMRNVMQIKNIELQTDSENGNTLIITGQSISSIVGQRVVLSQTNLRGQLKEVINLLLVENIMLPIVSDRQIPNFRYAQVDGFNTSIEVQVTGDNLAEWISTLCEKYEIGWDVYIERKMFVFEIYAGVNRSYNQSTNPYIVFSAEFDNLLNTDYQYLTEEYKNIAVVAGEGEGMARIKTTVGSGSGIDRFEQWVDAREVSSNDGGIEETEYIAMLQNKGTESLAEHVNNKLFDGDADVTTQYVINQDFFLGDVVQIENEYGVTAAARILEVIESEDESGITVIPTFSAMEV